MKKQWASVVITHDIQKGKESEYEDWIAEITTMCQRIEGNIDLHIIRPVPSMTNTYTNIIRFHSIEKLKHWMESDVRKNFIQKAQPFFSKDDWYFIKTGLDFLFIEENKNQEAPVRWKQFLITWSAIFPLSIVSPFIILPILKQLNFPDNSLVNSFFVSGILVLIMVYLLMPPYTRLVKGWLHSENRKRLKSPVRQLYYRLLSSGLTREKR